MIICILSETTMRKLILISYLCVNMDVVQTNNVLGCDKAVVYDLVMIRHKNILLGFRGDRGLGRNEGSSVDWESSLLRPIFMLLVEQQPLVAMVIIAAAKEEVRVRNLKRPCFMGYGQGWTKEVWDLTQSQEAGNRKLTVKSRQIATLWVRISG